MNVFTIRLSIVIKFSLFFGLCIFLALLITGYAFINSENKLVSNLIDTLKTNTQDLQQKEIDQQIIKLENTIRFNADMLGAISGVKIYSLDDITQTVVPFFKISEIQAIVVIDEEDKIYEAFWRQDNQIVSGKKVPPPLPNDSLKRVQGKSLFRDKEIGTINIYYTDRFLKTQFRKFKLEALKNFEKSSSTIKEIYQKNQVNLWVILGIIIILCITIVLISMKLMMSPIITYPLARMTEATERIALGDFDVKLDEKRMDEIGRLGKAINHMASRLSRFVTGQKRFLGDIAHELASPIARAQLALGILENKARERDREYVADAIEEIHHMSDIVSELLSFSRAEIIPDKINLTRINLLSILGKVISREKAHHGDIQVRIDRSVHVDGDYELLFRAFLNILRNALRYAKENGIITITAKPVNQTVVIEFSDSGPGVPEEMIAQIFDPFCRVEESRARDAGGVGLGLSIVKSCVESCKGTVVARNLTPAGFCISVTLKSGLPEPA